MPKRLVISAQAKRDFADILYRVGEYTGSELSIAKLANEFSEKLEYLSHFPKSSRMLNDGTRQAFCRRYRIIYLETAESVEIITVLHSLRKYPK